MWTVRLAYGGADEYRTRIGFREARFTPHGLSSERRALKLRGLDRHQTFPYAGGAMPARAQRRDAQILKSIQPNLVRTSHYPQSRHFLDACDELGLAGARRNSRVAAHRRESVAGSLRCATWAR